VYPCPPTTRALPSLTMAGSIIERIKLVLPRELCVLIYSFTFLYTKIILNK